MLFELDEGNLLTERPKQTKNKMKNITSQIALPIFWPVMGRKWEIWYYSDLGFGLNGGKSSIIGIFNYSLYIFENGNLCRPTLTEIARRKVDNSC